MIDHDEIIDFYSKHEGKYLFRACSGKEIYNLIVKENIKPIDKYFSVLYLTNNLNFALNWNNNNYIVVYNINILRKQGLIEFPKYVLDFIRYCDNDPSNLYTITNTDSSWEEIRNDILDEFNLFIKRNPTENPEKITLFSIQEFSGLNIYENDRYIKEINFEHGLIDNIFISYNYYDENYMDRYNKLLNLLEQKINGLI